MNIEKQRKAWYMYDFANSAFTTTVVTVFIGPYLSSFAKSIADVDGYLQIFGMNIYSESLFGYAVSLSVILQVLLLPPISAIADLKGMKKEVLVTTGFLGALFTIFLYFTPLLNIYIFTLCFIIANLLFGISIVSYNSFLTDLADNSEKDRISSIGWAYGFLGGGILLLLNLLFYSNYESLGFETDNAVRICLASAGLWWAVFMLPTAFVLKSTKKIHRVESGTKQILNQLKSTFISLKRYKETRKFLLAYILYNDGVQAVITFAAVFGAVELGIEQTTLIIAILMVQFVAFIGAIIFGKLAQRIGTKKTISISIFIWILALLYAYSMLSDTLGFFILAATIALVLGATQSLSRSLYASMIPLGSENEYFSFYEISERGTSWIGSLIFGLSLQIFGSYRIAILSLLILFVGGWIVLTRVNVAKGILEIAQNEPC